MRLFHRIIYVEETLWSARWNVLWEKFLMLLADLHPSHHWHCNCVSLSVFLTHWGRVTLMCVCNLFIVGSDNGLSPGRRQAIIWTNAGILLNGPLGTNFSEILIEIPTFSFNKMHFKVLCAKWRSFCLSLNVLMLRDCLVKHPVTLPNNYAGFRWSLMFS